MEHRMPVLATILVLVKARGWLSLTPQVKFHLGMPEITTTIIGSFAPLLVMAQG
jgi:hypothetical protein